MALLTGGHDDLGCFLRRIGIDAAEYSAPGAGGRLHIYKGLSSGSGASPGNGPGLSTGTPGDCTGGACPLWASRQSLETYDIVLLACEGGENNQTKPPSAMTAMHDWLGEGGKLFATHFHYTWFMNSPASDFRNVATWLGPSGVNGMGTYQIDTSRMAPGPERGPEFAKWLSMVGDASGAGVPLRSAANSVSTVNVTSTKRWIFDPNSADEGPNLSTRVVAEV
jgi:hypothetical protein